MPDCIARRRFAPSALACLLLIVPAAAAADQADATPSSDCPPPSVALQRPYADEQLICRNFVLGEEQVPYENEAHLTWGGSADIYDVYLGVQDAAGEIALEKVATTSAGELTVGVECSRSYEWVIVAKNGCGTQESEVRSFETLSCTDSFPEWECHPPVAPDFTWSPEEPVADQPLQLQIADLPELVREYRWDFGGEPSDSLPVEEEFEAQYPFAIYAYDQPGTYEIELTVRNPVGSDSVTRQIQVSASSPLSLPLGENAYIGEPTLMEAEATGCTPAPNGWIWDLAGGEAEGDASGANVLAVWSTVFPRQEKVVAVRNSACGGAAASMWVLVSHRIPISGPTAVQVGEEAEYVAILPSDPEICFPEHPGGFRFIWYFDVRPEVGGDRITVRWDSPGARSIDLRVDGCYQADGSLGVYVGPLQISGPESGDVGEVLEYSVSEPGCRSNRWAWEAIGGEVVGAANRETVSVRWSTPGNKQVAARNVLCGAVGSRSVAIGTSSASLSVSGPSTAQAGEPVELSASASGCSPADGGWSWTVEEGTIQSGQGSDSIVAAWSEPASRRRVAVRNSACGEAEGERFLEILPAAELRIDGDVTGTIGEPRHFRAWATGCTPDEEGWDWDLDGGERLYDNGRFVEARWWSPGTKTVTVRNSACAAAPARHEVAILDHGPDIWIRGPETVQVGDRITLSASVTGCAPDETGWTWEIDGGTIHSGEGTALIEASWSRPGTYVLAAFNPGCPGEVGHHALDVQPGGPVILDVERQLRGFFLEQTPLENRFTVKVAWNGTPGEVRFTVNDGPPIVAPGDESGASHVFRMDRDFPASVEPSRLAIVAVNGAGQVSEARRETIVVSPYPHWLFDALSSGSGLLDELVDGDAVRFRVQVKWPRPPLKAELTIPAWVPFIGGNFGIRETYIAFEGDVSSLGTGSGSIDGQTGFVLENKEEGLKTEILGSAGGSGELRLSEAGGFEVTAASVRFFAQGTIEREKRLSDVIPGLRQLESREIVGGIVRRLNQYGRIQGSIAPRFDVAAQWAQDAEGHLAFEAGTGTGSLELKGAVGLKFEHVRADVWLGGGGSLQIGVSPFRFRSAAIDGAVGAGFTLDYLWDLAPAFEYGFHCKWPSPGEICEGNPETAELTAPLRHGDRHEDNVALRPIVHDYARFGKESELRSRAAADRAGDDTALISNVFPGAAPVHVELGSGALLLWEHQDPAEPVHRSLDIAWSLDRGDGWSEPAHIADGARLELSPVAAADGRGRVAAAWLRIGDPAHPGPVTTLEEAAGFYRGLEVVTSVFDPATGWSPPEALTEDGRMDGDLRLAASREGRLMLTWLSNAEAELVSTAEAPSRLLYSFWDAEAGRFAPPKVLAGGLVGTSRHASAVLGDSAFVLLERDGRLDLFRWDGGRWSAAGTFAAGPGSRSPQMAVDAAGEVHVVWLQDGGLVHATLSDPAPVPVLASSATGLLEARLLASPAGPLALVWPDLGEEGSADPTALVWDPATRAWSEPRPLAANIDGAEQAGEIDGFFDRDGRLRLAWVATGIERRTRVVPLAGKPRPVPGIPVYGRSDLHLLERSLAPDPAILPDDIALEPARPRPGDPLRVDVAVRNAGDLPVSDLEVRLFAGQAGPEGQLLGSASVAGPLAGGAAVSLSFDAAYPASGGDLIAVVEPVEGETSAANNQALIPLSNQPPAAAVEASVLSGPAPLTVAFDASASSDPEGGALAFHWTFADGSAGAEGPRVSHTFLFPGVYPVTVLVSDGYGSRVAVARVEVGAVTEGCGAGDLLCLGGDRFHVRASWRTSKGDQGTGRAIPLTGDTGAFWFFGEDNTEVVLKVLDGCALNGRFWVFAAGLTDVEVELKVHDTWSGETRTYRNPPGTAFEPIQDTAAFATCGAAAVSPGSGSPPGSP